MDFANRGNQQARPAGNQAGQPMGEQSFRAPDNKPSKKKLDISKFGAIGLLTVTTLLILAVLVALIMGKNEANSETDLIDTSKYQAVFLNSQDGQVYFGKMAVYNKDLYSLTDIYYVRVNQQVQPGSETPTQNISLAKLGGELHCPVDQMFIARDQVLYWENIKDEGQVVSAIKEYQQSGETIECGATGAANQQQQQNQNAAGGTAPAGSDEANQSDTDNTDSTPQQ